jgi:hypothetical protein
MHETNGRCLTFVMPGLVPGIHVLKSRAASKTLMARTSPAMTTSVSQDLRPLVSVVELTSLTRHDVP